MNVFEAYENQGGKLTDLARAVGCGQPYLSGLKKDPHRVPGIRLAFALEEASGGLVPARAWVQKPARPRAGRRAPTSKPERA